MASVKSCRRRWMCGVWFTACCAAVVPLAPCAHAADARMRVAIDRPSPSPGSIRLPPLDGATPIEFAIVLPMIDLPAATRYALAVSTDFTRERGHYLTPEQFARRFGGNATSYSAVKDWLKRNGMTVAVESGSHTLLGVRGTASSIEAAFGVTFERTRSRDGHVSFAASDTATMPAELAGAVSGIVGLSDDRRTHFAPLTRIGRAASDAAGPRPQAAASGNGPGGGYSAADLRTVYGFPPSLDVQKQAVALFEQGGFDPADIATYAGANKIAPPAITVRGVAGYGGGVNDPSIEFEAVADIDMVLATDTGAPVLVYEQGTAGFRTALLESLAAMADDDRASTISISYGQLEKTEGSVAIAAENQLFVQLAIQGQSVFASAGDDGAYAGTFPQKDSVIDPTSQPFVTSVGGTTLFTDQSGQRLEETAWSTFGDGHGATGGGFSAVWALPVWQRLYGIEKHHSVAEANGGSDTMRNVPDVAALADPDTGVSIYSALNGGWLRGGGTGISAPIWAGIAGLASSGRTALGMFPVGFLNPDLYYFEFKAAALNFANTYDIINGYNGAPGGLGLPPGYLAGFEFDDVSGWGAPYAGGVLIGLYTYSTAPFAPIPGPAQNLQAAATSTTITASWEAPATGAKGYVVEVFYWPSYLALPGVPIQPLQVNVTHATHTVFRHLQPSTDYAIQIIPANENGGGFFGNVTGSKLVTGP